MLLHLKPSFTNTKSSQNHYSKPRNPIPVTHHPHRTTNSPDRGHQTIDERQHHVPTGGGHDLTESDTDALALVGLLRLQTPLQDRDDLGQHALAQFTDQIAQRPGRHLQGTGKGGVMAGWRQVGRGENNAGR